VEEIQAPSEDWLEHDDEINGVKKKKAEKMKIPEK
jgi:hypothetical protein